MENLPTLNTSNSLIQTSQTKVAAATNKDFKELIGYIIALLGVPKDKQPASLELMLIINYFKIYFKENSIEDVMEAFDLAVQKRFEVNLDLYGGTLSMRFISDVLIAYKAYKKQLLKKLAPKEEGMNNLERLKAIIPMLSPEVKNHIAEIGEVKKSRPDLPPLPHYDIHQSWLRLFDRLKLKFETPRTNGRFISRYGMVMNVEEFFNYKAEQLYRVKEYLKIRNEDKL